MLFFLFSFLACRANISFPSDDTDYHVVVDWKTLLRDITTEEGIDYHQLQEHRSVLERYLGWVGSNGPRVSRRNFDPWKKRGRENKEISFYANAFNAWTVYEILENHLVEKNIETPLASFSLSGKAYQVDGEYMSLYHLKEERLLADFQNPLIHIMLFDGTESSPALQYWNDEQLPIVLKNRMRNFLQSPAGAQETEQGVALSSLFLIEKDDFLDWSSASSICEYLIDFTDATRQDWLIEQAKTDCDIEFLPASKKLFTIKND